MPYYCLLIIIIIPIEKGKEGEQERPGSSCERKSGRYVPIIRHHRILGLVKGGKARPALIQRGTCLWTNSTWNTSRPGQDVRSEQTGT